MAERWKVVRGSVKHKGTLYFVGDLLPEDFTDRDRARHIYSRRMEKVEVEEAPIVDVTSTTPPVIDVQAKVEPPKVIKPKGAQASPTTPTGTKNIAGVVTKKG